MQKHLWIPLLASAVLAMPCLAGNTRLWTQGEYDEFQKGSISGLSVRSDGRLTLAPTLKELYDSSAAYLWTIARDSRGVIYAGGGPGAVLFRLNAAGGSKIAEFDGLEVHAIAIDKQDRVYAATLPDGKIYRISKPDDPKAKPEVFYDPKQKYIWALAFASNGDLFAATGDAGEIHRISPEGKGSVFFKSEETHVRSLAIDPKGNLIAGTDPGGLVLRIDPSGTGFVLHQMPKREVAAVAVASDGSIYASGTGGKQAATVVAMPVQQAAPPPPLSAAGTAMVASVSAQSQPAVQIPRSASAGGSEVWRIYPDGQPERVFANAQDVVYAIAFDRDGTPVLATGNRGILYRIDSQARYTSLRSLPIGQITALSVSSDGAMLAATGNTGKVFRFGPEREKSGTIESDVFDAGGFSYWGRIAASGDRKGGAISLQARTGNLDRPQKNWSAWTAPIAAEEGGKIASPASRFLQWKATLTASANGASPELDSVDTAYLTKNVAPRVNEVETTPANYKFATPAVTLNASALATSITLPAIGKRGSTTLSESDTNANSMSLAKGWLGVRWTASDPNGDDLEYTVEIRGVKETEWKLLKDKLRHRRWSFDSSAFADGEYRLRITASDTPSNTPQEALRGSLESEVLIIDNTPPVISQVSTALEGGIIHATWHAADAINNIQKAEYSVDGGDWTRVDPAGRLSDSKALDYDVRIPVASGREHTVALRVVDDYDNQEVVKQVLR